MLRIGSWAALCLLLAATLVGTLTFDRRSWPGLVGDEATYLMQAQSLAWDFDLRYSRRDFDRFVEQWGVRPEGLILQSGDGGRTLTYSKPASYAAFVAPFLRLSPLRGAIIANALLLALAAALSARTLERRIGPAAPLWVAVWIFASVVFAYVFWVHADLFMMSLTAISLALAYGASPEESRVKAGLRWGAAALFIFLVAASRPFYLALLLPVVLTIPKEQRKLGFPILIGIFILVTVIPVFANLAEGDAWTVYGGERQSFDSATGFPEVDFPASAWKDQIALRGSRVWRPADVFDLRLTAWNALYFLSGRHVGVLPYYLPLLLGLLAFRRGEGRGWLIVAVLAACACFLLTRPFNFYGGGGAIANRYFLPLYPALWFAAGRPARASWAVACALLAAPFLWPLWKQPAAYMLDEDLGYRYVSAAARDWLPYETTQSHLKPGGGEDFMHQDFWIKPLTPSVRPEAGGAWIRLTGEGQILLGSEQPLREIRLLLRPPLPASLGISGAETLKEIPRPGGRSLRILRLDGPRAVHRMWWGPELMYLYQFRIEIPEGTGVSLQLRPPGRALTTPGKGTA
ncbi:MAG TPA: hypothetical protein VF789_23500 [Thermoanaerobaculia bacterium]